MDKLNIVITKVRFIVLMITYHGIVTRLCVIVLMMTDVMTSDAFVY
jgi:hypothetical protein